MSNAAARVTKSLVTNVRRPGALPALVAAAGLLAFLAFQRALFTLVGFIGMGAYAGQSSSSGLDELTQLTLVADYWQGALSSVLLTSLPLAFGVFVSLWILAPIADSLVLRFVIARSVLAGAIGSVLVFLVSIIAWFIAAVNQTGSLFGNSFPWPVSSVAGLLAPLFSALTSASSTFVLTLPGVVLAGVLLWMWLRGRDEPHNVSGILDEV